MKWATAVRCVRLRCQRADCAVIRKRKPRTDRDCDGQATRCLHVDSFADAGLILKCFLLDPQRMGLGSKEYFRATRDRVKEVSGSIPRPVHLV